MNNFAPKHTVVRAQTPSSKGELPFLGTRKKQPSCVQKRAKVTMMAPMAPENSVVEGNVHLNHRDKNERKRPISFIFEDDGSNGSNGSKISADEPPSKKKRCPAAKYWCGAWNNPPDDWRTYFQRETQLESYSAGKEVAPTTGTVHIQYYIGFKQKKRAPEALPWLGNNPTVCKGSKEQNCKYTQKDGDFICTPDCEFEDLQLITVLRPWQQTLFDIVTGPRDDRTIYWIYEEKGNVGKSAFTKLLCAKHRAIVCAGKAADMKYQIAQQNPKPKIIIFDVPRSNVDYLSYTGIEEIKNGCFASQKYESGMVIMNSPHILIFANTMPKFETMSMDRWKVGYINRNFQTIVWQNAEELANREH